MARSQNPVEAFRREQKKKELKKNQVQRQREKQAKLQDLDVDEIRDRLKKLERQVQQNPADGPTRKRKQELEDTLNAALKKQKAMVDEEREKEAAAKSTMTLADINAANRERYQNPENSIYYHPVFNPFGAPPPGQPQRYRVPPPKPEPTKPQDGRQQSQGGLRVPGPPQPSAVRRVISGRPQRPGKRPPLPPGPPPPSTIQVPARPPLPSTGSASVGHQPPPPPPPPTATLGLAPRAPLPPPPLPQASSVVNPTHGDVDMEHRGVVDRYPPLNDAELDDAVSTRLYEDHEDDAEERAEQQQRLRSLVPTTVRVQRPAKTKALAPVPRPPPPPPPGPSLPVVASPAPSATKPNDDTSEYDAFMEEMKSLGAV